MSSSSVGGGGGSNSGRVGEIFVSAGAAFNTLGQLTQSLSNQGGVGGGTGAAEDGAGRVSAAGAKWTEEEVEMLHR